MNTLRHDIMEAIIINRYVKWGLITGDVDSYDFMGAGHWPGEWWKRRWFNYLERKYIALGYIPLSAHDWMVAGGYGAPYKHLLRKEPYEPNSKDD